jgi:hypothetical protein
MRKKPGSHIYSAVRCFLLRSLSSEIVSLVPLPLGNDIQGFTPSPMTKIFVTLGQVLDAILEHSKPKLTE